MPPGGSERSRSWTEFPTTVAVPVGEGDEALTSVKPAGAVRFEDPSCWVPVSFV